MYINTPIKKENKGGHIATPSSTNKNSSFKLKIKSYLPGLINNQTHQINLRLEHQNYFTD